MIDRKAFFEHLRAGLFRGGLLQGQVDGHNAILDAWKSDLPGGDPRWLAYMLATACHETARTMQPVRETLATSDDQAIARLQRAWQMGQLKWVKTPYWHRDGKGHSWFGRGLVQLTHRENYIRMKNLTGVDLENHPEKALEMDTAIRIMFMGMTTGAFTGRKLGDFFDGATTDWQGARRIINGTESAARVASHAQTYHAALRA